MLNLLFDDAKILCIHHTSKKKHFARLAKQSSSNLNDILTIMTSLTINH